MNESIRILIVEDLPADVELAQREVRNVLKSCIFQQVETREDYLKALETFQPDLIISDYHLPHFDGMTALKLAQERESLIPVILWTGSMNEDTAVDAMKSGAVNYVIKENIKRLGPAVVHALEEKQVQTERKQAEAKLAVSEVSYRRLFEAAKDGILIVDGSTGEIVDVNPFLKDMLGYSQAEFLGKQLWEIGLFKDIIVNKASFLKLQEEGYIRYENLPLQAKDGHQIWVEFVSNVYDVGDKRVIQCNIRDITKRKQAENALIESERQMQALLTSLDDIVLEVDEQGTYLNIWTADESLLAQPKAQLLGRRIVEVLGEENGRPFHDAIKRVLEGGHPESIEYAMEADGSQRWFMEEISPVLTPNGSPRTASILIRDITERKHAEEKIQQQLRHLSALRAIDIVIASNFDLRIILQTVITRVVSELQVDAADILLLRSEMNMLEYAAGSGFRTATIETAQVRLGESYAGRAALDRRPVHIPNLKAQPDNQLLTKPTWLEEDFVCYYGVPLISKGKVKGVLEVFHRSPLDADADWLNFLEALAGQAAIGIDNSELFGNLQQSNLKLQLTYDKTIEGWSNALDLRDKETEGHTRRVTETTMHLARALGFANDELLQIRRGALLHDIGKMGVPDQILLKPGALSEEEWVAMKRHPQFAFDLLSPIDFLRPALDIPYCHHEKWDGTGYPRRLKGEQIPLSARMFAIVDVYDALTSDRPYRPAWTKAKALEQIKSEAGTHFDPNIVEEFLKVLRKD